MATRAYGVPTAYPMLREALDPSLRTLPDAQIENLFTGSAIEAADVEGLFADIGSAFTSATRAVGRALPQIAQVALPIAQAALPIVGTAFGGPVGAALGGVAGQALGALAQPRGAPPPAGAVPAPPGAPAGNPAAGLLQALGDPRTLQALVATALGRAGTPTVPVGASGTPTPIGAFANLLSTLGAKAFGQAEAAAIPSGQLPTYLYREGVLTVDPASPEQRAERLMELLGETVVPPPRAPRATVSRMTEADEFYDELDEAELLEMIEDEGADLELDE
jgi:hypothetical protein